MILLYAAAAIAGLVACAFGSIGVLILLVPEMRYEAAMWWILAAGSLGAVAGPLLVRRLRRRRR